MVNPLFELDATMALGSVLKDPRPWRDGGFKSRSFLTLRLILGGAMLLSTRKVPSKTGVCYEA
jgi:hypothetical protein